MIRLAVANDARQIAEVHVQSWKETYTGIMAPSVIESKTIQDRQKLWMKVLNDSNQYVWVYEENGKILGFSDAYLDPNGVDAELRAIYIVNAGQGRGIGKQFISQLFDILSERKFQNLSVYVLDQNPSRYFYEKMGAKYIDEEISNYGEDLKELCYQWKLSN